MVTQFSSSLAKLGSPVAQATKSTLLPSIQLEKKIETFFSSSVAKVTGYNLEMEKEQAHQDEGSMACLTNRRGSERN